MEYTKVTYYKNGELDRYRTIKSHLHVELKLRVLAAKTKLGLTAIQ